LTKTKQFNVKWPFKVTQGHVFWGEWKGDKGVSNNIGLNAKASEETVSENTENCRFRQPRYLLTPPVQGTSPNIPIDLILPETKVVALHPRR